jgi:hypothetical protein
LGVPPQEKCGVGLFAAIFFAFLHLDHAQGKKSKKGFPLQSLTLANAKILAVNKIFNRFDLGLKPFKNPKPTTQIFNIPLV